MYEDEIDYIMENTPKDLIYFNHATAHIAVAGADSVEVVKRYADSVNFTHLYIELDKSPISHADSAKKSYDYLSQLLED